MHVVISVVEKRARHTGARMGPATIEPQLHLSNGHFSRFAVRSRRWHHGGQCGLFNERDCCAG